MPGRILVVDDEANIRKLCRLYLEQEGFQVSEAADGEAALAALSVQTRPRPDLVILDLMLPGRSGLDIARDITRQQVPLIMLTARSEEVDRIVGLELGADDYITKPFSPRELVARVRAVLRRVERGVSAAPPERLEFPHFAVDLASRILTIGGTAADCPPKEFDLLVALARQPHRVFSRAQLLEQVWDYQYYGDDRTVDVHVQRLRRKIEPDPDNPRYIITVRGAGYRFEPGRAGG